MTSSPPTLSVGIVGLGQGRAHLAAFQAQDACRVTAVADANPEVLRQVASEHGIETTYPSLDVMLDDRSIDIVVVATPDHLHGEHVIAALEAGKHVLGEIPMAMSIDECRRIIELTDRHGLKYQMGNQVRYAHCLQDVAGLIHHGDLGEIFYGEGEYLHNLETLIARKGDDHWRTDAAIPQTTLLGGGPHALDTLRWLMNTTFTQVSAFHADARVEWSADTPHTTVAIYKAANGGAAKVTTSYGMIRPYCLYYSVYGSDGSFERTRQQGEPGGDTTNYLYHSRLSGTDQMIPVTLPNFTNPAFAHSTGTGHGSMEFEQARDFVHAVRNDTEPSLGPREAAASILPLICGLQVASDGGGTMDIPALG